MNFHWSIFRFNHSEVAVDLYNILIREIKMPQALIAIMTRQFGSLRQRLLAAMRLLKLSRTTRSGYSALYQEYD